tara:strand:+ start:153 stop:635 length:483 start_codon:yes stop_codon:yes gene_type:complete
MARTPFKLKSSPTKGNIDDFFKGATEETKTKRAELKENTKAGESSYQASNRLNSKKRDTSTDSVTTRSTEKRDSILGDENKDGNIVSRYLARAKAKRTNKASDNNEEKTDLVVPEIVKPKVTYEEAYKKADIKKYPTFASFKDAAELYNSPEEVKKRKKK